MKYLHAFIGSLVIFFSTAPLAFAATDPGVTNYTNDTLNSISAIASVAVVLFLIRGGYLYITSTGQPEVLEHAKKTIKNALIGLVLILGSTILVNILIASFTPTSATNGTNAVNLVPINAAPPSNGAVQVFIDTMTGFMQTIVQSATKPVVDAIISYLTTTPSVLHNSTIHNFWLVMLGITDSLYVLVVALLGLHLMSGATFGFEELELKHILPRIGLSFLGANISLFLADYIIVTNNVLISAVLNSTGGLDHAWVVNTITLPNLLTGGAKLVTLLFFILFLIIAIVLLILYVSRLVLVALGAVLSPFIFLLWGIPKLADFAEIATKVYIVTIFVEFVHVVVIQLASAFLAVPDNPNNSLVGVIVAIGLFATLLKIPSLMMQMVFYTTRNGTFKKIGGQMINVMSSPNPENANVPAPSSVKAPRKVVEA
ncbi:MAG: pilin [Candidatus Levyibacteriota bacterium]